MVLLFPHYAQCLFMHILFPKLCWRNPPNPRLEASVIGPWFPVTKYCSWFVSQKLPEAASVHQNVQKYPGGPCPQTPLVGLSVPPPPIYNHIPMPMEISRAVTYYELKQKARGGKPIAKYKYESHISRIGS